MRAAAALLLLGSIGCPTTPAASAPPLPVPAPALQPSAPLPDGPQTGLPHGAVVLHGKGGSYRVDVELALDSASQEKGLMYRRAVADGSGMLFVFASDGPRAFWMKNTWVALDMLFISAAGKVVGLIENAEPLTLSPRPSGQPARYVLELAGGAAFAHGLAIGDTVEFEGVP